MTRAEAFRKIIKEVPGVCFVTEAGTVISGSVLLDIYDKLNEDITQPAEPKAEPKAKPKTEPAKETRRGPKPGNYDVGKMVALHKAGWNYVDIADECHCSPATAQRKVKEALDAENK